MKKSLTLICVLVLAASSAFADFDAPAVDTYKTAFLWNMDSSDATGIPDQAVNSPRFGDRHLVMSGGTAIVPGRTGFGNCLQFDGVDDKAYTTPAFWQSDSIRITCWVWKDSSGTAATPWIVEGGQYRLYCSSSTEVTLLVFLRDGTNKSVTTNFTSDAWQYITAEFMNGQLSIEVKDESDNIVGSNSATSTFPYIKPAYNQVGVGHYGTNATRIFKGKVDDLHISIPSRSASATSSAYLLPYADTEMGTYGLWHFDSTYVIEPNTLTPDDDSLSRFARNHDLFLQNSAYLDTTDGISGFGSYLALNGLNAQAVCMLPPSYGVSMDNFRAEAWIKIDSSAFYAAPGVNDLHWVFGNNYTTSLYIAANSAPSATAYFRVGGTNGITIEAPINVNSEWQHIAGEFTDGQKLKIYLNGEEIIYGCLSSKGVAGDATQPFYIGVDGGTRRWFYGNIDEVRFCAADFDILECGDMGYLAGDINKDCYVDFQDFAEMAANWMLNNNP